jgi:hypothetical protein
MALLIDAFVDWAKIVMKATRPTPIIRADALAAVRFGLRMAFSRASAPVTPRAFGSGQPMNRLSGSDTVRPSTETPKKTRSTPRATGGSLFDMLPNSPPRSATAPNTRMPTPTKMRCFDP